MPDGYEKETAELERLVRTLPQEALDNFRKFTQRHRYFVPLDGHHAIQSLLGDVTCSRTDVFLLSGNDKTGNSGKAELHLNDYLCHHGFEGGGRPVLISLPQFTALPSADAPVVLTAKFSSSEIATAGEVIVLPEGNSTTIPALDVFVTVSSWNLDGTPAKDIPFSWVSTVQGARAIFIGG